MLLFACICHTPTMAGTPPTPSAATMAGTDDENTEDDTGGTGDNTGNDTGGDTGGDTGTALPADREPVDVAKYIWWIDDDFEHRTTVTLTASNAVSSSIEDIDVRSFFRRHQSIQHSTVVCKLCIPCAVLLLPKSRPAVKAENHMIHFGIMLLFCPAKKKRQKRSLIIYVA